MDSHSLHHKQERNEHHQQRAAHAHHLADIVASEHQQQLLMRQELKHIPLASVAAIAAQHAQSVLAEEELPVHRHHHSHEDDNGNSRSELTLSQMRELGQDAMLPSGDSQLGSEDYPHSDEGGYMRLASKRSLMGVDDELSSPHMGLGVGHGMDVGQPDKKRRKTTTEQQLKRHKYDILKAFFRIYFAENKDGMVLKDSIFNLYARKLPDNQRIARNAMYRHMWTFFKDKITAFQSNYREYIKGIKLLSSTDMLSYDGVDKDLDLVQSAGVIRLFDFTEEELEKNEKGLVMGVGVGVGASGLVGLAGYAAGVGVRGVMGTHGDSGIPVSGHQIYRPEVEGEERGEEGEGDGEEEEGVVQTHHQPDTESLVAYIEQLEHTANNLALSLRDLKQKLRRGKLVIDNTM